MATHPPRESSSAPDVSLRASFTVHTIGNRSYVSDSAIPSAEVTPIESTKEYLLATVVHWQNTELNEEDLQSIIAGFRQDDVWTEEFLDGRNTVFDISQD